MATYSQVCSNVGSFTYGNRFTLYVVLTNRNGDPATNKSVVDYNVYFQNTSGGGTFTSQTRLYFALNGGVIKDSTSSITGPRNGSVSIASGSTTIDHNSDGTKSISYHALVKSTSFGISGEISGTFALTTIPRASSVSGGSGNIGGTTTISVSRASTSFTHTLKYSFGSLSGTIATGVGTSYTWTIPTSFYAQIPNDKIGWGTIYCDTYNGNTLIGTKSTQFTATVTEASSRPTVSATLTDTNATTKALTGNASKMVKGKSTGQLVITSSVKNSATIKSVTVNGTNVGTAASITKTYANISTASFTIVTTDSRGFTNTSYVVTPSYVNYVPLTLSATIFRPQPTGTEIKMTYSGNYFYGSFGAVSNTLSITWKYRVQGASEWTNGGTITPTFNGNTIASKTVSLGTNYSYQTAYEFQIVAVDKLTTITQTIPVSVGMPVFHWGKDFMSVNKRLMLRHSPPNMGACRDVTVVNSYVRLFTFNISAQWKNASVWFVICDAQSSNETILCNLYARRGANSEGASVTQLKVLSAQGGFDFARLVAVVTGTNTIEIYFKMTGNDSPAISILSMTKMFPEDEYGKIILDCSTVVSSLPSGTVSSSARMVLNQPSVLYDNSSGTTGTVTLSSSAANFSYLEIFFVDNKKNKNSSVKVSAPNGKCVDLHIIGGWNNGTNGSTDIRTKTVSISGTSITNANINNTVEYSFLEINGGSIRTHESIDYIYITKVIGYR
jgi:hypothetical protein